MKTLSIHTPIAATKVLHVGGEINSLSTKSKIHHPLKLTKNFYRNTLKVVGPNMLFINVTALFINSLKKSIQKRPTPNLFKNTPKALTK